MTDGFDDATAYGLIDGLDDARMGWARYAQATKHMNLNSGLFYVRAAANTVALMEKLAERLSRQKYWDQTAFNEEIFFLSHGDVAFVPVSVRVMDIWRFQNSKARRRAAAACCAWRCCGVHRMMPFMRTPLSGW
jgi:arabinosyltransferase